MSAPFWCGRIRDGLGGVAFAGPGAVVADAGDEPGEGFVPVGFGGTGFGLVGAPVVAAQAPQVEFETGHPLSADEDLVEGVGDGDPLPQGVGGGAGLVDAGGDGRPHLSRRWFRSTTAPYSSPSRWCRSRRASMAAASTSPSSGTARAGVEVAHRVTG